MTQETAGAAVVGIAAIGAIVWLFGLAAMARATRLRRERAQEAASRFDAEGEATAGTIVGEVEVDGRPEDLAPKLASKLARDGLAPSTPLKVSASGPREVRFEMAGSPKGQLHWGRVRLEPAGPRTRLSYVVEISPGTGPLVAGWVIVGLGLVALVAGVWLMLTYVVPHPNVRGQAFQMVQAIHLLWPPFLLASLSNQPASTTRASMEALLHNLPLS